LTFLKYSPTRDSRSFFTLQQNLFWTGVKSYREEVLDAFTFRKLGEATALTQAWLWMYNNERPHESLGYKSPVDFAQERLRCKAPQTLLCDSNFNWKSLVLNASN
jgi:putative transposase